MYTPVGQAGQYTTHERVSYLLGLFLASMCILFNFSLCNVLMYHTNIACKDMSSSMGMTLSVWLQVDGISGIIYTLFSLIFLFVLFEIYEKTRTIQIVENTIKGLFIAQTLFLFLWSLIGMYMMGSYYEMACQIPFFKTYMWVKISISIVLSTVWLILFCVKLKTFFNDKIRSYFYQINTTYQPCISN